MMLLLSESQIVVICFKRQVHCAMSLLHTGLLRCVDVLLLYVIEAKANIKEK